MTGLRRFLPGNTGRRYGAVPHATTAHARVRLPVQSPQGRDLPTVTDSMAADDAERYALAILAAVTLARHEHAELRATMRERAGIRPTIPTT